MRRRPWHCADVERDEIARFTTVPLATHILWARARRLEYDFGEKVDDITFRHEAKPRHLHLRQLC